MEPNKVGRPPIHTDPAEVERLCIDYFLQALSESKPPTITGLTLHLGFAHKQTLYDYADKPEFTDSIKKAITKIEQFHEEKVAGGDKCVGNIFVLKNFGWKDRVETEVTGSQTIVWKEERTYEADQEADPSN